MKRIRLPRYLSLNTITIYIALFCVVTYALLENANITYSVFSKVKMPLMYLGGFCILFQANTVFKVILRKKYVYLLAILFLLCILLIGTVFVNKDATIGYFPFRYTVRLLLYIVELFLLMIVISEHGNVKSTIRFVFWYILCLTVINDLLMFSNVLTFREGRFETYIVGGKFSVSYLHLDLLAMWIIMQKKNGIRSKHSKLLAFLLAGLAIAAAIRVNCMTGILGSIGLLVLLQMIDAPKQKRMIRYTSPWMLLTTMLLCVALAFIIDNLMEMPAFEYLVEDVFGRDKTITGRTNIYDMYIGNMEGHWLAGYGYGNGNEVASALFGYENVQNALLQWILQVGVPTTVAIILLFMQVFRQIKRKNLEMILPLVALIYVFIIIGVIETTFNMAFFLWFALIFMLTTEKQQTMQESYAGIRTA